MTTHWLTSEELHTWMRLEAVAELLPGALDSQLRRSAGLTHFEYLVLAKLSEADARHLRLTRLSHSTNSTLPRLSHVVKGLAARGFIELGTCPQDRRATVATLTDSGMAKVVASAPGHVANVRRLVFDQLDGAQVGQLNVILEQLLMKLDPDDLLEARGNPVETDERGNRVLKQNR